jgi:glyoxylase-like metal-dependent hydrolase (beta-lactamase superfamily II)
MSDLSQQRETLDLSSRRLVIGDYTVTSLKDGYFDLPGGFMVSPEGGPPLDPGASVHIDVNAFLVEGRGKKILIDTGAGPKLGPTANHLSSELLALSIKPEEIDAVFCTHIHPDHTNGLIDAQGAGLFTNATVHIHKNEKKFWVDEADKASADMAFQFEWTREAFSPYLERLETFSQGELVAGVSAVPLFGHTPGHSGFLIDGGSGNQLLIIGDCVHAVAVQAKNPQVYSSADMDHVEALASRIRMFDMAAQDNLFIAGMHIDHPGYGRIARDGSAYTYIGA